MKPLQRTSNQAIIYFNTHDNLSTGLAAVDSFTYTATDNSSTTKSDPRQPDQIYNEPKESENATVQLSIYGANDRPTAGAVSDSLTEDALKGTNLSFADIDLNDSAKYYTITSLLPSWKHKCWWHSTNQQHPTIYQ